MNTFIYFVILILINFGVEFAHRSHAYWMVLWGNIVVVLFVCI